MMFETDLSEISIPSFCSSPCIRGAPQNGFALAMSRTSFRISGEIGGFPGPLRRDLKRQNSLNPCLCHPTTVSEAVKEGRPQGTPLRSILTNHPTIHSSNPPTITPILRQLSPPKIQQPAYSVHPPSIQSSLQYSNTPAAFDPLRSNNPLTQSSPHPSNHPSNTPAALTPDSKWDSKLNLGS